MPTVPIDNTPQIDYRPSSNIRVPTDAPLSALGGGAPSDAIEKGVDAVGKATTDIGEDIKKKADDASTIDAYTKLMQKKQDYLYGYTDPNGVQQPGALQQKGKDALGLTGVYAPKFDNYADQVQQNMTPDQTAMFQKIRSQQKEDLVGTLEKHTYQELQTYSDDVTKAGIQVNQNEAIQNYSNPDKVQQSIDMQQTLIRDNAQKKGLPPEMVQQQLQDAESSTWREAINRAQANQQDVLAKQIYDDHKDQITGTDKIVLEKSLEEGSLRSQSQKIVDDMETKNMSPSTAQDYFKTIQDPQLRDKVEERYKMDLLEKKRMTEDNQTQLFQGAYNTLQQAKSLDAIPPNVMRALTPAQQNELKSAQKQIIEGTPATTDLGTYYNLAQMATEDRQKFMSTNLLQYQSKLSPTDFKKFADMQTGVKKGDPSKLDGFMSDKQVVDSVLGDAGINPAAKPTNADGKKANDFRNQVDIQVQQFEQRTGKKATNDDIRQIAKQQMINVTVPGKIFGTNQKHLFEMTPDDQSNLIVPKTDADQITSALQKKRMPVTPENVRQAYMRGLKQGG